MKYSDNKHWCKRPGISVVIVFMLSVYSAPAFPETGVSVEVRENIDTLIKTSSCPGCNLAGADLNRINLSGADLRKADLTGATFFLADLSNANLSGAILRGAQFGGTDLAQADLRGADLRGALLTGAYMVGALMDGIVADRDTVDKETDVDLYEKVFIPGDDKAKESPEKQDVKIAKRRDFAPVPPVIEPGKLQKGDDKQGPSELVSEQEAPPVKSIAPVGQITIAEQQETGIKKEPAKKEKAVKTPDQDLQALELVANSAVKVHADPKYQKRAKAKKTNTEVKEQQSNGIAGIKTEETENKKGSDKDPVAKTALPPDKEKPAVQPEDNNSSTPPVTKAEIQETDLAVDVKQDQKTPVERPVANGDDKTPSKQEQGPAESDEKTAAGVERMSSQSRPAQDMPAVSGASTKDSGEELKTQAADLPLVTGSPDAAVVPSAGKGNGDHGAALNTVDETMANVNRLLDTKTCLGCNLTGVDLTGKKLVEADLERANLSGSNLEGIDLREANLKGVSFRNANLKNSDLRKADLYKADFSGADLTGADFAGAQLDETNFAEAIGYKTGEMPK